MTTYVLGAGASYPVYPLASQLLKSINDYVAECAKFVDRFDYEKWPEIMAWLEKIPNPLLRQAYRNGLKASGSGSLAGRRARAAQNLGHLQ